MITIIIMIQKTMIVMILMEITVIKINAIITIVMTTMTMIIIIVIIMITMIRKIKEIIAMLIKPMYIPGRLRRVRLEALGLWHARPHPPRAPRAVPRDHRAIWSF